MKRLPAALILSAFSAAALAQATPPPTVPGNAVPAAEGARQSVPSSSAPGAGAPATQPPQRGFIAPVIDIRIQGEGIGMPKPAAAAPAPEAEKPPAAPGK